MIPKRIFYVWGAGEEKKRDVQVCIQTWRQIMPDYEIIEINDESVQYFDFQRELKENKWFRTVYEKKMWAYVADYIRIKTLYDNGGIYFDTDVSVVKTLDKFLSEPAFVGIQSSGEYNYTEPAILGGVAGNKFLKSVLDFYNDLIWREPIFTMPEIFQYVLQHDYNTFNFPPKADQEIIKLSDITLYPERFFIPFEYGQKFTPECVESDTHTIHWFGGSWVREDTLYFLRNKHIINFENTHTHYKKIKLFGLISLFTINKIIGKNKTENIYFKIYKTITLLKIRNVPGEKHKTYISLFGIIPIIKRKKSVYRLDFLLFYFIPLLRIKD